MAINRLQLYNIGLAFIGESGLSTLSDSVEARRLLDEVWNRGNGAIRYCLEKANWAFARRTIKLDTDADLTPQFGYTNVFTEPTDWIRLDAISGNEKFNPPLLDYEREAGLIHADITPIYLRFISDDSDYGGNFDKWPESFSQYVGSYLGSEIAPRLKNAVDREALKKDLEKILNDAKGKDAVQEPTRWTPLGSWSSARMGRYSRRDRGSRSTLIG